MFIIKQNAILPVLEAQLFIEGQPFDLDLCAVQFYMKNNIGNKILNKKAEIVNSEQGKIQVKWNEGELKYLGVFVYEFQINLPDGKTIIVPNDEYYYMKIIKDLTH